MRDCSELCDMAAEELACLRADGIEPTDADIVKLNWLAWQFRNPQQRLTLARGNPVMVGGAILWPLTMHSGEWFRTVGLSMPEALQPYALAYAMAHGRDADNALVIIGKDARRAVRRWRDALRCTADELIEALAQVAKQEQSDESPPPIDADGSEDASTLAPGELSAFLCATCGGPPEVWERACSQTYAIGVLRAVVRHAAADGEPMSKAEGVAAFKAFHWAVEKIRQRAKDAA